MNWDRLFDWYLKNNWGRKSHTIVKKFRPPRKMVQLRPDLENIKMAYDEKGNLNLADVKPVGLLVQSKG